LGPELDRPWLSANLRTLLAELLDVSGPEPGMVGANMAASVAAARALRFDEELGPGARGFDDDVLFNLRLKDRGYRIVGAAGPPAIHHPDPARLNYAAMLDLAQRSGQSHAYLWHHWLHSDLRWVRLRQVRDTIRLAAYRRRHRHRRADGIDDAEFDLVCKRSLFSHLAIERRSPAKYTVTAR
jgi:hypothetical protein